MHPYDAETRLKQIDEVIAGGPYRDTWESLMQHETPRWFVDAKFGIFIHWGVYAVPAYDTEWYPRMMYVKGSKANVHQEQTYGPLTDFGYKDFIPMFKAEKFDPKAWVELFKKAGARYVVPVAEHHDGFAMYKSELTHWNAAEMGPHRDVTGELTKAIEEAGLVNGASTHRIEHWFFLSHGRDFDSDIPKYADDRTHLYWPSQAIPDEQMTGENDVQPGPSQEFLEDWMMRTVEIIDRFHPKQLYFDWWIMQKCARPYLKKIAAYYFNRAKEWGEEVMLINKMGAFMYGTATRDMERGSLETAQPEPWQTDTAAAKNSWCYTEGNDYKKPYTILQDLIDAVAKNGCMLLNIGPKADGIIGPEDTEILTRIGEWMAVNGEAIYESRTFFTSGEGPTLPRKGAFADASDGGYTAEDFRFTIGHGKLYAMALKGSSEGRYCIKTLAAKHNETTQSDLNALVEQVEALDPKNPVKSWKQTSEGLLIETQHPGDEYPAVFRITLY